MKYLSLIVVILILSTYSTASFYVKGPTRMFIKPSSGSTTTTTSSTVTSEENKYSKRKSSKRYLKNYMSMNSAINIKPSPKIIIAGAPAAGKGTQCEVITSNFGVVHLSTGDILRSAVKQGTDLGLKAKSYMDAGQLVPDELIISVVCERLKQDDCLRNGWLLDGFPRTRAQAEALAANDLIPDSFLLLDVPEDVLVDRVSGRRTDPVTGKIYHLTTSPPESEEIAARLVQRSDDTAEKIIIRYREFKSHIDSVRSFYESKTIRIDGTLTRDVVSSEVLSRLTEKLTENPVIV